MNEREQKISNRAILFARKNKKKIAKYFTDVLRYLPDSSPVSVFMAGSPGAGKTESSKRLLKDMKGEKNVVRIDSDDLRSLFPEYNGTNSHLFQFAVSILVSKIHDKVLENKQNFIFDGTFSQIEKARKNIKRSLDKQRFVQVYYVYQNPEQAWKFVQKRELKEGRRIRKEDFIQKYFLARTVVNQIKKEFGKKIRVDLLIKNIDGSDRMYEQNIQNIDSYVKEQYTEDILLEKLA